MFFSPSALGSATVAKEVIKEEKKSCQHFGPCGIGKELIFLNSFYFDRCYYLPIDSVQRIFKRVAMSKGGFTGKGIFASIPYLVVEYDGNKVKQCNFRIEEDVDMFLNRFGELRPKVPLHSLAAERKLKEKAAREEARYLKKLTPRAQAAWDELAAAAARLEENKRLYQRLAIAAKRKRRNDQANPAYKWVALAIVLAGAVAAAYGVQTLLAHDTSGIYWTLLGLAAVFLFAGANVLPTARNNKRAIDREWQEARAAMEKAVGTDFPVPPQYAHPIVLQRMIRVLREGRAQTVAKAFEVMKQDLKALNNTVQVEQEEYDEVVEVKPIFLLCNYQ